MKILIAVSMTLATVLTFQWVRAQGSVRWIQVQGESCTSRDIVVKGKKAGVERSCSRGPDNVVTLGLRDDGVVIWK